jgi:hypothetical protein
MTINKKKEKKAKKTYQSKITYFFKKVNELDFLDDEILLNSNLCCFCGIEMGLNRLSQYCSRQCLYGN